MNPDTDPLVIREYDPTWPDQFSDLASRVTAALGALRPQVEHVGSTAVPGLAAKPVIDMDVVLALPSDLPEAICRLGAIGYVHEGDLGIVGRESFRWPAGEARHHLYVLIAGAEELRLHLAFREALRSNRIIRDAYAELKKDLALRYAHDRKSYTEAKSAFITRIIAREDVAKNDGQTGRVRPVEIPQTMAIDLRMQSLMSHRSLYAEYIVAKTGLRDQRIVDAFSRVEREKYCGPGPWKVWTAAGYLETPSSDAAVLYQDILIGLLPERSINNGEPSLHARCLVSVQVRSGDHVVHVGTGSGYYTAILAELAGPEGMIYGYEIVPELADRARDNLRDYPYVLIDSSSGSEVDLPPADVIYVSAGATGPMESWLNALRPEGRLIFPMTPETGMGGMLLISRRRSGEYDARFVGPAMFIPCIGARDADAAVRLTEAFARGDEDGVRQLYRDRQPDADKCWFDGGGWWLSY